MASPGARLRAFRTRLIVAVPTRKTDWRLLGRTLREVLGIPRYALLATGSTYGVLSLFVISQNLDLIGQFVLFNDLPLGTRLSFLFDLYPLAGPTYTLGHALMLLGVSIAIGVNIAMIGYQLAELNLIGREGVAGAAGVVLGTFGAGCAACGTAILGGALSVAGITGVIAILPLDGREFLVIALALLVLSGYSLAKAVASDAACPVDLD